MPNNLKMKVAYRVPVRIIYETLTNSNEITKFTQCPAKFDKKEGGEFNFYDGFITGVNVELQENKKIVQNWKFSNWSDPAEVTMNFKEKQGDECVIIINVKDIPERDVHKQAIDLKNLETGFRGQIFQKISDWLGYPLIKEDSESESD